MKQYRITLEGLTPLLMHRDNLIYAEKLNAWRKAPDNKANSVNGDDRSPAWTWIGYVYHDGHILGVDSDNIMTMLREGGVKVSTGKGKETYKKQTQSGIMIDQQQWPIETGGQTVDIEPLQALIGELDFVKHIETAESLGFELSVKRAKVGQNKHVRVRPMFRTWKLQGSLTVLDEEVSGITSGVLETILNQAGALCGLCDWRPSSPRSSGRFGKFAPTVELIG